MMTILLLLFNRGFMVVISESHRESIKNQKLFELEFLIANWPADPFGGVWVDEEMVPSGVVSSCMESQARISANLARFAVEHRNCVRNLRGRVVVCVSPLWWDDFLALAG